MKTTKLMKANEMSEVTQRYIFNSDEIFDDDALSEWWREQMEYESENISINELASSLGLPAIGLTDKEVEALNTLLPAYRAHLLDKEPDFERWCETVWEWREVEMDNLNKRLPGDILVIANTGRWNGHRSAHKFIGNNLNEILTAFCDECSLSVYCDDTDVISEQSDHDGTSVYIFRLVSAEQREKIEQRNNLTNNFLLENSASLSPYVAEIYGW